MREQVSELLKLGPMPGYEDDTTADEVKAYQDLLQSITPPVTDEEAKAMMTLFGPDDFYGLAWTMAHLIESAPGWPIEECLRGEDEWAELLRARADAARARESN